jgi:hypothetical protein
MSVSETLRGFVGRWELTVDLAGAEGVRGDVVFELMGDILVQRTTVPVVEAPDSCCVVVAGPDGAFVQHYFDSRGVARLYAMTFDGSTWTLERTTPDFTPLEFCQRFVGSFDADGLRIAGEWSSSGDGHTWRRDFGLTYQRVADLSAK